jgi:hypothetical protein
MKSYNSRGLAHSRCFLGFYVDATALAATAAEHTIAVQLPTLAPGAFQGLFWNNVETVSTEHVLHC